MIIHRIVKTSTLALMTYLCPVVGAFATPIQVETSEPTSSSQCTLSDAIDSVLFGTSVGACSWQGERIVVLTKGESYELARTVPPVETAMTLRGGVTATTPAVISWASGQSGRFFDVKAQGHLTLEHLKLTGGSSSEGGALRNQSGGTVDLFNTTFDGSSAGFRGGAIHNEGSLDIEKSTLQNNTSTFGSAIYNGGQGTLEIAGSLFADNTASFGGAVYQQGGAITVQASTFSANQAYYGAAIYGKSGDSAVDFSTFRNNSGSVGGAVFMEWGSLLLGRSALTAEPGMGSLCFGSQYLISAGGNAFSDNSCGALAADDIQVGGPIQMSELVTHGGFTASHVPLCDWVDDACESPILDKLDCPEGGSISTARDQRDQFPRRDSTGSFSVSGGQKCDIGAYESVCQSFDVNGGAVQVMVHEYQIAEGDPVLVDNGACFGHPLFEPDPEGCRIQWNNYGGRIGIQDVVFLEPNCPVDCFVDPQGCKDHCETSSPEGWTAVQMDEKTFAFEVPDCNIPETSIRYLLGLRDTTLPPPPEGEPLVLDYWDPKTPIMVDDVPNPPTIG